MSEVKISFITTGAEGRSLLEAASVALRRRCDSSAKLRAYPVVLGVNR